MQGDLSALRQVMEQSGMGGAALNQVTPQAPTAKPNMTPSQPPQGGGMPAPQTAAPQSAQQAAPQGAGLPAGDPEAQIILKALSSRLGTLGKLGR